MHSFAADDNSKHELDTQAKSKFQQIPNEKYYWQVS